MITGLYARRATGLTVAEREDNFTRTESVARWSREGRATYEAKRKALLFVFFYFLTGARCSKWAEKYYMKRGRGFFFLSEIFDFIFVFVFAVLLWRVVLRKYFLAWGIYVRPACERA